MVAALLEQLTEVDENGNILPGSKASAYVWIDLVALDHSAPRLGVSDAMMMVEDIQASCSSGESLSI
jgi:hypothetical protein